MFYFRVYANAMCCLTVDAPAKMIMESFRAIKGIGFIEILIIFFIKTYSADVLIPNNFRQFNIIFDEYSEAKNNKD